MKIETKDLKQYERQALQDLAAMIEELPELREAKHKFLQIEAIYQKYKKVDEMLISTGKETMNAKSILNELEQFFSETE